MKLSEKLRQYHECGDFGKALAGMPEESEALEARVVELESFIFHNSDPFYMSEPDTAIFHEIWKRLISQNY